MISKNDYVIANAKPDGKQYFLMKVLEVSKREVVGVPEKLCHITRDVVTVPMKQFVLNLGQSPQPGKVYGVEVSARFQGRKEHEDIGLINFFYKPDPKVGKDLWAAFSKVYKILKRQGLEFLLQDVVWEILPYNKEKYSGMYIASKNDTVLPRIQIRPESMKTEDYPYVILHELAHHLHRNFLTSKKLNAAWIRLFNTSIKVSTVKKEVSQQLLDSMLSQEDLPSDFKGQLDEEERLSFSWIIRTIQSSHNISIKELDILFEAEMHDEIKALWPIRTIPRKELAPVISPYATKNYRECLAEAVSYHLVGKKIPESIVKLVEKSISYAKANREK